MIEEDGVAEEEEDLLPPKYTSPKKYHHFINNIIICGGVCLLIYATRGENIHENGNTVFVLDAFDRCRNYDSLLFVLGLRMLTMVNVNVKETDKEILKKS